MKTKKLVIVAIEAYSVLKRKTINDREVLKTDKHQTETLSLPYSERFKQN